jgi:ATP-dependent DNA helicase RecG
MQRKEIPEIPMDAVREGIINSYCHRDYRSSQNNAIMVYSNRIEIYNPGKFPEGLAPEDFINGSELSIKRNPLLAQLMYYVKDIGSFGTGLKRIADTCEAAGVKVEFEMRKLGFAVVFYRPDIAVSDGSNGDNVVNGIGNNAVYSIGNNHIVNDVQAKIIALMHENPQITAKQLADNIGIAQRNIQVHIKTLRERGIIKRDGATYGGRWIVVLDA